MCPKPAALPEGETEDLRKAMPSAQGGQRTAFDAEELERVLAEREAWTREELAAVLARLPRRKSEFTTDSGIPVPDVLDPASSRGSDYIRDVGYPGRYPFTRGPHPTMYRGRLWTMRQFGGSGTSCSGA
jgi:methylmalonyl-CoA mutase N-terminal domain/subunit